MAAILGSQNLPCSEHKNIESWSQETERRSHPPPLGKAPGQKPNSGNIIQFASFRMPESHGRTVRGSINESDPQKSSFGQTCKHDLRP